MNVVVDDGADGGGVEGDHNQHFRRRLQTFLVDIHLI